MEFTAAQLDMSKFDLDPLKNICTFEATMEFCEYAENEAYQLMNEARDPSKPGFFTMVGRALKYVFGLLVKGVRYLVNLVKRLFGRKHPKKTPDEHLEEIGISPSAKTVTDINEISNIGLEKSDSSTMNISNSIKVMYKGLKVKFTDKGFGFVPIHAYNDRQDETSDYIQGHTRVSGLIRDKSNKNINEAFAIFSNPRYNFKFKMLVSYLVDKRFPSFVQGYKEFRQIGDTLGTQYKYFTTELSDLEELSKLFSEANTAISSLTDEDFNSMNKEEATTLNSFIDLCNLYQYAINAVTASIAGIYQIDARYIGSVKDVDTLSKFVQLMIEDGIPPKYVAYNTYLCIGSNMNTRGSKDKPIWGQTRLVLFPKKDAGSVYKIALSSAGILANRSEYRVTDILNKSNQMDPKIITPITDITQNGTISTSERASTDGAMFLAQNTVVATAWNDLNHRLQNANARCHVNDLHSNNMGFDLRTNKPLIIDYGYVGAGYIADV